MTWRDDPRLLSSHDFREVDAFTRFLNAAGPPGRSVAARAPGWIPYILGGPWPPPALEHVHPTAWTLPG